MIELKKITWDNWMECLKLKVTKEQENFVASNTFTMAQSFVALSNNKIPPMTLAITKGDTVIGLTMLLYVTAEENTDGDAPCYDICRFMIGMDHQGKGYGRESFEIILNHIKTFPLGQANDIYLSYEPENTVAKKLYASFGFVETGEIDHGEAVAKLVL